MSDDETCPAAIFDGMPLSQEEQAKVDVFRINWRRQGAEAWDAFIAAEPSLILRAVERIVGPEAVREAIESAMDRNGLTRADLDRIMARKLH
jgi:hypothetical protein